MRYSNYEQRQMDIAYSLRIDAVERRSQPCKNDGNSEVHPRDGSCLRCGAVQGEACRDASKGGNDGFRG